MPYLNHQYYEVAGSGPTVALLHGHTLDHRMWSEHLPALAERYRVIAPDLAGHGRSGRSRSGSPLCCDLTDLLDHLGAGRAAVCGISMGGAAAISFALHHPERCAALVPVDSALYGYRFPTWPGPGPYIKQAHAEGLANALEGWLADPLFAPARAKPCADRLQAIVREYPGVDWLSRPTHPPFPPGPAEAERLGEIAAPTLVMVGESDLPDFQGVADRLARSIPGARKQVVAESGHLPPFEQPEAFRAGLLAFLDEMLGV